MCALVSCGRVSRVCDNVFVTYGTFSDVKGLSVLTRDLGHLSGRRFWMTVSDAKLVYFFSYNYCHCYSTRVLASGLLTLRRLDTTTGDGDARGVAGFSHPGSIAPRGCRRLSIRSMYGAGPGCPGLGVVSSDRPWRCPLRRDALLCGACPRVAAAAALAASVARRRAEPPCVPVQCTAVQQQQHCDVLVDALCM